MTDRSTEELVKAYLSDGSVREFDAHIARFRRKRRILRTAICTAFMAITLAVSLITGSSNDHTLPEITTVELMETISALTENELDEISSIVAKPRRHDIVVTAEFRNGTTKTYLMRRGADGSSIEMTAQNLK